MTAEAVRGNLLHALRRDLIGPLPDAPDDDLAREKLGEQPSRWYLTGFIAPVQDAAPAKDARGAADPDDLLSDEADTEGDSAADPATPGHAPDDQGSDSGPSVRRRLPNSLGLTVLLPHDVTEIEVRVTWGDYATEPPLPEDTLEESGSKAPPVEWRRLPREAFLRIRVPEGRGSPVLVPESATPQIRGGGALQIEAHARSYAVEQPEGPPLQVQALTVVLVNHRRLPARRFWDLAYAFQARLELRCPAGFVPRCDLSGLRASDDDRRIADLQFRDVTEYAVGRNTSAGWAHPDEDGHVRTVWTDHLPAAEVERVEPNETIAGVEFGMEALAALSSNSIALKTALDGLPAQYAAWIAAQAANSANIPGTRRQQTAARLIKAMQDAEARIAAGIALLASDAAARCAFQAMNEAVARAARQRNAGPGGDPAAQSPPVWRPFQLAFILLNLAGLHDKQHPEREWVDLLFFPTGGGKTEAYLGLAAWAIVHRRLCSSGVLGAGVTVLMRYTLRLLTLDQLGRAAGVVCALELMRGEAAWQDGGRPVLGDWPIEIGLFVGSAITPNRLGGRGNTGDEVAITRVRRHQQDPRRHAAPAPIKACPWCGTPFTPQSFHCVPNKLAPQNMELRCASLSCPFQGARALPVVVVDQAIYRRLPAFLVATVDKFAGLPWNAEAGAFFRHVNRADQFGFYGAADSPNDGLRLWNDAELAPPDLVIQDELHLISGPLGTVAGLYETALDSLSSRKIGDHLIRPKVVASTATVRRAADQIKALFDRPRTEVFPPPGPDRRDSFFALTKLPTERPARLYVGLAAQGKGPKLVFLRALTTLLAAAQQADAKDPAAADPYMTAVCYFNALRELGGARRIVEDEVRARLRGYGTERRRRDPVDQPFADRAMREPMELTSRVTTDKVADAKRRLDLSIRQAGGEAVDVALATNMISVGLDIPRLGLMLVQGQPKTASEYIQATSRVGRQADKPGLVLAVLNVHKPRDRAHHESFRAYHNAFYRAVEATSVTPWAARAMDRALAAVLVAITRHLEPHLAQERAVVELGLDPALQNRVRQEILRRAPAAKHAEVLAAVDGLLSAWQRVAANQTANGFPFHYGRGQQRLMHQPLDVALRGLSPEHRRFTAGQSMRDVEAVSPVKIYDPHFQPLAVS